ncbi:MAG: AMP-binding protein [Rhodobacteraceae bacterium]|jgi:long-chain acyl-CoA synthetase|nr:AMP-binding protein [Paracoccaceae bacterium]
MNLALWLERTARAAPDRAALFRGAERVARYRAWRDAAAGIAAGLAAGHGIRPGDRVALFLANAPEYLMAFYGIWYAGAAVVPINAKLHPKEAAWICRDAGARLAFSDGGRAGPLAAAAPDLPVVDVAGAGFSALRATAPAPGPTARGAPDLAWLFYTSGTTGRPRGVRMTHAMLQAMSLAYLGDVDDVSAADAALYAAPMSHGAGLYNMIHVLRGARHVVPASGGFDTAELLALAADPAARLSMFLAPTMIRRLTDAARAAGTRAAGIRTIVYGGGPMYVADIVEAVDRFGPRFVQIYGQGECPMCITALSRAEVADRTHPRWRARLASVGRAQSVVELRIGDARGHPLPTGETGEVMVRGVPVMPGYWQNPEATGKALQEGWLRTGDMGVLDEDGYLTLKDRSKDMIISGGTNIYPREVEEVLLTHPSVREVAVVGRPSVEWGEDVVAFIVCAAGATLDPAALDAHCLDHLARFKRPKLYRAIAELPKNNYGKVLKTELRARLAGAS